MNDIITSTSNVAMNSAPAEAAATPKPAQHNVEASRPSPMLSQEPPTLDVPTSEEVFAAADKVTAFLQESNSTRSLRISMNETLDRAVFTVVDSETNEIVRHIPSDEVVAMAEFIEQWVPEADEVMPQGILFDGIV
jgi:flagellar protein FlaG